MESGLHREKARLSLVLIKVGRTLIKDLNYKNPVYIFYAKRLSKETACHHYQRFSQ